MFKVGLTGGIGSGKTTIAKVFEVLGIPVLYADDVAKKLMHSNLELKTELISLLGDSMYKDGNLDRKKMAALIFEDASLLAKVNALVHPATISYAEKWMEEQDAAYVIKEAAILFESNTHLALDFVIGVNAPQPVRVGRIIQRDAITKEEVHARMSRQMDADKKMTLCDAVIDNSESIMVLPQILELHEQLLGLAKKKIDFTA